MRKASLLVVVLAAAACGGTSGGGNDLNTDGGTGTTVSVIQSFSAASASIASGASVQLTATFSSGTGVIDHNVGAVQSGVPVTDGIFPESKEFLLGYWIVDVATPERAYAIAGRISAAPGPGGVPTNMAIEVRQFASAGTAAN